MISLPSQSFWILSGLYRSLLSFHSMMNETLCDRVKNSEREGRDNNRLFNILYSTITTIKNCYVKEKSIPNDFFLSGWYGLILHKSWMLLLSLWMLSDYFWISAYIKLRGIVLNIWLIRFEFYIHLYALPWMVN